MIFINSVEKGIAPRKYLQSLLPNNLKNIGEKIMISFLSILKVKTKTDCLEDFLNDNTRILIFIDATKMRADILDIKRVIQWTIIKHSTFITILQQIGRVIQEIEILAIAVIFVKSKHILLEDITNAIKDYFFTCLPIAKSKKDTTEKIVSSMYKDNIQIRKKRDLSTFHKIDL